MEEDKKDHVVSKIMGTLVESEANALEVLLILDKVKDTFLERSWHISSDKKADRK